MLPRSRLQVLAQSVAENVSDLFFIVQLSEGSAAPVSVDFAGGIWLSCSEAIPKAVL